MDILQFHYILSAENQSIRYVDHATKSRSTRKTHGIGSVGRITDWHGDSRVTPTITNIDMQIAMKVLKSTSNKHLGKSGDSECMWRDIFLDIM